MTTRRKNADETDVYEFISEEKPGAREVERMRKTLESMTSTTKALRALADAVQEIGDEEGGAMIHRFVVTFAAYEIDEL